MSIYEQCSQAARDLAEDSSLTENSPHPSFFTDLDVVLLASQRAGGFTPDQQKVAMNDANNVLKVMYGKGQVARYGPVRIHAGVKKLDYSRIVHANPTDGPKEFKTPNGTFKRLLVWRDHNRGAAGRRFGTNRDDRQPWEDQPELALAIARARVRVAA
jgi:hypothetical protein